MFIINGVNQLGRQIYNHLFDEKADNIFAKITQITLSTITTGSQFFIAVANKLWSSVKQVESFKEIPKVGIGKPLRGRKEKDKHPIAIELQEPSTTSTIASTPADKSTDQTTGKFTDDDEETFGTTPFASVIEQDD